MSCKFFLTFALLVLLTYCGHTQVNCDQAQGVSAYSADSLLEHALQDYYTKGHFNKLLKKHGIKKFNCSGGCESVWVDLEFTIDDKGKIVPVKVKDHNFCHRGKNENFIKNFYLSLQPLTMPIQFAGRCFTYRFGRALKC